MLRQSVRRLAYVNKGFAVGSKGQKHQAFLAPTFLYRFPGKQGPGPVLMKYMHTLGCFPTGLETPIRIADFERTYLQEHIPLEVEEWLGCFLQSPILSIQQNVDAALQAIDLIARPAQTLHRRAIPIDGLLNAVKPVQQALAEVGFEVPAAAVRFALQRPTLRKQLALSLTDWSIEVGQTGSTPHRRMASRQAMLASSEDQLEAGDAPIPLSETTSDGDGLPNSSPP
jgi:hypothetical protein